MFKGLNRDRKIATKALPFFSTSLIVASLIGCGSFDKRQQSEAEKSASQAVVETATTTTVPSPPPERPLAMSRSLPHGPGRQPALSPPLPPPD